jgi:hypothetical protein
MTDIKEHILKYLKRRSPSDRVCTAKMFATIGTRAAIDQALKRMATDGTLKRIARGLYAMPEHNAYLDREIPPDPAKVAHVIAHKFKTHLMGTGMGAANRLGLTNAVSVRPEWETDGPARNFVVAGRTITFKQARKRVAFWAGRPAAPVVQALYWIGNEAAHDDNVVEKLRVHMTPAMKNDLRKDLGALPEWMAAVVRKAIEPAGDRIGDRLM